MPWPPELFSASADDFVLTCGQCGRSVVLTVRPGERFLDLEPAKGWLYRGSKDGWRCAGCSGPASEQRSKQ